ncbi:MAG: RNA polymerase sigma factor [Gemmatimonadota bacterium]
MFDDDRERGGGVSADPNELTDTALVHAAGDGDMDALGALYVRHHRRVYELCVRMVGDADVAEDLAHEGFLRVSRYGSTFDGRSSVASWLYRLVRNRCLDDLATRRREEERKKAWKAEIETREGVGEVETDREAMVREALDRLKPEQREVLVLSRFAGLKYREIAEVCDLSLANVQVRAHRAMSRLHALLEEMGAWP